MTARNIHPPLIILDLGELPFTDQIVDGQEMLELMSANYWAGETNIQRLELIEAASSNLASSPQNPEKHFIKSDVTPQDIVRIVSAGIQDRRPHGGTN